VFNFLCKLVWSSSLAKKNWERYYKKCTILFMQSTRHSFSDFNKTWILLYQISYKSVQWKPRSWVRIPPGAWMFVYCECCVLSVRGLCDELIIRPCRRTNRDTHDEANNSLWQILQMPLKTHMSYLWDCLTPPLLHNWYINSVSLQSCGEGIIFWGASFG
jgi:hypothetical protein